MWELLHSQNNDIKILWKTIQGKLQVSFFEHFIPSKISLILVTTYFHPQTHIPLNLHHLILPLNLPTFNLLH